VMQLCPPSQQSLSNTVHLNSNLWECNFHQCRRWLALMGLCQWLNYGSDTDDGHSFMSFCRPYNLSFWVSSIGEFNWFRRLVWTADWWRKGLGRASCLVPSSKVGTPLLTFDVASLINWQI
jgi:hypothetical protein